MPVLLIICGVSLSLQLAKHLIVRKAVKDCQEVILKNRMNHPLFSRAMGKRRV